MENMKQSNNSVYFFPAKHKNVSYIIVLAGITTSAITLFFVNYLASIENGIYLMGYYFSYVLPIGALGVGLLAGSGYGLASFLKGFRISVITLCLILLLQITVYFLFKYLEFNNLNWNIEEATIKDFLHYFDTQARSFTWEKDISGSKGKPLGLLGYGVTFLEILGFAFGALIPLLILYFLPYCEHCRIYMTTTILCFIPAGKMPKIIKPKDKAENEAYVLEQTAEFEKGNKKLEEIKNLISLNDGPSLISEIEKLAKEKENAFKLTKIIKLELITCKRCENGHMLPSIIHNLNEKVKVEKLNKIQMSISLIKELSSSVFSIKNKRKD